MPIRILLGAGLALNAIAMWSMSRINADSNWPSLIPGFVIGGIGIGMVNAPLASTAVSTVRQERAGMASGINNTFRQIGIATGIAALGAIFATKVEASAFAPHPSAAARASFVAGLHDILLSAPASPRSAPCSPRCWSGGATSSPAARPAPEAACRIQS